MTSTAEEAAQTTPVGARAAKEARVRAQAAHVAHAKAKSGRKAKAAKKAPKSPKKGEGARDGSKAAKILDLLKRPDGATAKELMKATGWQPHSLRGFLSGTVSNKMGLSVTSTRSEDGERTYSVKA